MEFFKGFGKHLQKHTETTDHRLKEALAENKRAHADLEIAQQKLTKTIEEYEKGSDPVNREESLQKAKARQLERLKRQSEERTRRTEEQKRELGQ
ncbi:hypothetical protein HZC00_03455 [Candidatus Kaiserbacteria bacterium]|nr:hypothetical protein [Candidatus Kaiserbacteria bacterium]